MSRQRKKNFNVVYNEVIEQYGDVITFEVEKVFKNAGISSHTAECSDPAQIAMMHLFAAAGRGEQWAIKDILDRRIGKAAPEVEPEEEGDAKENAQKGMSKSLQEVASKV